MSVWYDPFYQKMIDKQKEAIKEIQGQLKEKRVALKDFDTTYPDLKDLKASTRIGGISLFGSGRAIRQNKKVEIDKLRYALTKAQAELKAWQERLEATKIME